MASDLALKVVKGTAYLAYSDAEFNDKATFVKSDGGTWTVVGTPGFTSGSTGVYSLTVSGSTLYLAFRDYQNNYRATVMKLDDLKSGIYIVKATGDTFSVTRKMVVEL
ncbi:hypothetical protein BA6E_10933 [Bacteroidales bacterium 6E]|nr:hypothetical protein BA6E_10933 [Bacteroidales bacterium 6E]